MFFAGIRKNTRFLFAFLKDKTLTLYFRIITSL